ncbi:uncharacterized protein akap12a [Vanacampus margaritifer]
MGDTQSAFEEGEPGQDAAERGVGDAQRCDDEKLLKNRQIAANCDTPLEEVNGICEEDTDAGADGLSEKPPQEVAAKLENVVVNEKESLKEAKKEGKEEEISLDVTEVEAKQNYINESFKTFFSKVGLKLKRGSRDHGEIKEDGPESTEAKNPAEQIRDDTTQVDTAHERQNEDSKRPGEEEAEVRNPSQNEADSPDEEWTHLDDLPQQDPSSPSSAKEDVTMSPIKKFFTTRIFAGLAKKRMSLEDETMTRELVVQEVVETAKETSQNQQADTENTGLTLADGDQEENSSSGPEAPKEFEDVSSSPLKKLLLGSRLTKLKRQKDANPSAVEVCQPSRDNSDRLLLQTDAAQNDKSPTQPAGTIETEEESPWATFKKLLSPKKQVNRSAFNNDDVQTGMPKDELKPSEGGDILECSVEEGQKRKDAAISWDAILCTTSHTALVSDDKTSADDVNDAEAVVVNYDNNGDVLASTPKGGASPPEGDVESAWTAFKRLMSPKRKAKPVEEGQRENDENFSFSAKIFPGWKTRKSISNEDQEATSELGPGDPNSKMPAVVPLSDYDTVETEPKETVERETDVELNQDFLPEVAEEAQSLDTLQTEETKHNVDFSETEATNEDQATLTEFSGKALTDIPEEGEITESTTADDLIEVTSQAVTAPHPVDVCLAHQSEMISALSQRSGQTSGASTPVLAESQIEETEELMQQIVERIPTTPESDPLRSDQMLSSASFDTLETFGEDSQLPEVQKSNAPTARTDLVVHEMEAAMDKTESSKVDTTTEMTTPISTEELDTMEIPIPIPTEQLDTGEMTHTTPIEEQDTEEMAPQILTEEGDIKETKSLIPSKELDTQEMTPPFSTEKLNVLEILTPIPTEKPDTQEIEPPTSTVEHDTDKMASPIATQDLDFKEITPAVHTEELDSKEDKPSTKGLGNEEITTPACTEEPDNEEMTLLLPPEELDIKEIKPPIPTERLDTAESRPPITTCKTRTPIQSEELNTKKITPPVLREELDNQEIAPPIHTEELNTMEITIPMATKELDTWEMIPPIRTEELDTKEIKKTIPTEQLGIEEIAPPARTAEPDIDEMTPSVLTSELSIEKIKYRIHTEELDTDAPFTTEEIKTPIKTDELSTKEIAPLVLPEELDTREITPPISTEELDIKEITTPSPVKGLDTEELRLPIPTSKAHETEEITPPLPTEALDTQEVKLHIHTEDLHIKEIAASIRTRELDTEEILRPTSTEEPDTEDITPLISTKGFKMEEIETQFRTKELDTNKITTSIPTEGRNTEEFLPQIPIQELHTNKKRSPFPTQVSDTEEIVPPVPTGESNTDKITLSIPTKELDFEASKLPIPTEEFDSKEITPYILIKEVDTKETSPQIPTGESNNDEMTPFSIPTKELDFEACRLPITTEELDSKEITPHILIKVVDTKEISPPVPTEELDREEIVPQIPIEKLDAVEMMHPISTHEFDIEDILPSIPTQMFDFKEIAPQLYTEELDAAEMTADGTEDSNLPKSQNSLNELNSFGNIHEFVDGLTDVKQRESSEQLLESKDVSAEDDLEDLASNPNETVASIVDSVLSGVSVSIAEHESGDGGSRYVLEPVKLFTEEDHIPVVDELQRSKDVQDDTTNLQGDVTAETITNEPELETIAQTDLKETDAEQDTLLAVTIHLEEQKVKVTSEKVPEAVTEELEPTPEILSEASLNSVHLSGAKTEVLDLQECSLQLAEDEILSDKVAGELKDTIERLPEISIEPRNKDLAKTPVDTSIDELIQEIEAVQAKPLESEKAEVELEETHAELKEDIHEEVNDKDMPLLETDVEIEEKDQKTVSDTQIELIKEDEDIVVRDRSVKDEEISQSILVEETVITEVKDRPVPLIEDKPVSEDQRDQAQLSPEQEVVQESCLISDEHKEVGESLHPQKTRTEECEETTAPQLQTPTESAKDEKVEVDVSETELVKEIEGTQSKQSHWTESGDAKEAIAAKEKMTEELKENPVCFAEVQPESDQKAVDAVKTELEGERITEGIAEERTASVEMKEKTVPLSEIHVESEDKGEEAVNEMDNMKNSDARASEEAELLQSEETTESILEEEILPSELKEEAEPLPEVALEPGNKDRNQETDSTETILAKKTEVTQNEAMKCSSETEVTSAVSDQVQEPEEFTAVETETVVEEVVLSGLEIAEESIIQKLPKETLVEEITKPEMEDEIASKGEQTKPQPDQALDGEEGREPENTADDQKDGTQVTEAHVALHQEEKCCAQIFEKVIYEEIPEVCGNLAGKVKLKAHPSDTETRTEGENWDLPDVEVTTASVEHALVTQVTMCHFKEVSTSLPDLITTPSGMQEPLLGSAEAESTETALTEPPMTTDDLTETAQMSNEALMMHVPATVTEDNDSIQAQVVHLDITSAERSVDQMLEVVVREKGVIDTCSRNIEEVELVPASMGVEETHEDYAVMCHEIVPHVMENLLETLEQMVSKEVKEVEFGKGDGHMELPEKELACPRENSAEASHQEATPQGLEAPTHQRSLEEKEEDIWVLEAEELMAPTDEVGKAPVANEEPSTQTYRYRDTEPAEGGHQTLQDSLRQMDPVDCQTEKDLTEEGVHSPEPLSQIDLDECQDTKSTEEGSQIPKGEEALSQIETEELSLLNLLAELKTAKQSEVSLQAVLAGDSVVSVDNRKETEITGENVQPQETERDSCPIEPAENQTSAVLTKESCQTPKAEESVLQKEYIEDQKEKVLADKHVQPPKESIDTLKQRELSEEHVQPPKDSRETEKQMELLEKHIQIRVNQEPLLQNESTESQKQMEPSEGHDQAGENQVPLPQKQSTEIQKQTVLAEEYVQASEHQEPLFQEELTEIQMEIQETFVQASETQEPIPENQSTETQKQMELSQENEQAREKQEPILKKESTETIKQMGVPDTHVQARENQEFLPPKESNETQKQMELSEEHDQAGENQVPFLQKESTEIQKQMEQQEEHDQAGENQVPFLQKESTEIQKQIELQEEHDKAGENQVPFLQKESTEIQKQIELQEEHDQAGENQVHLTQKESTGTQKQMELQEKYVQASETQEPMPEKQSTEIQKQMELSQEHDQAGENQVPFLQKESTETQKQMELSEEYDQKGENEVPLLQIESTETQKQMELSEEYDQKGENKVPLLQIESTETQKQMEAPEENTQVRENQVLSSPKEPTETQKLTEPLKEHVQASENQECLPQNESTETKKQMEVPDENVQASENQVPLPQKVSNETQKQPEQTEEFVLTPEMEMTSFPKESAIGQKQGVQIEETFELAREMDSSGMTVTTDPPVLLDSGLQTIEAEESVEETVATTNETRNLQATEASQTAQKPETETPIREADDEQDIWMDAKEEVETQEDKNVSAPRDESPRLDDNHGTKTTPAEESETLADPEREAESESHGDDFAIAFDDSKTESATAAAAAVECD